MILFNENNFKKDSDHFLNKKLTLKDKFFAVFDHSTLHLLTHYNNFLLVHCLWIFAKHLSNFVSFHPKLDNPYCHNVSELYVMYLLLVVKEKMLPPPSAALRRCLAVTHFILLLTQHALSLGPLAVV